MKYDYRFTLLNKWGGLVGGGGWGGLLFSGSWSVGTSWQNTVTEREERFRGIINPNLSRRGARVLNSTV